RTVHRAFTSARSLTLALRIAGLPIKAPTDPSYGIMVPASATGSARVLLGQTLRPSVVALSTADEDRSAYLDAGIDVVDLDEVAADLAELGEVDWIGVHDPDVGPTHYEDLLAATAFGEWDRLASRPEPLSHEELFSLTSALSPPGGDVAGHLFSRGSTGSAGDLGIDRPLRTHTWIRDELPPSDPPEGDSCPS